MVKYYPIQKQNLITFFYSVPKLLNRNEISMVIKNNNSFENHQENLFNGLYLILININALESMNLFSRY